jgi:hypothetical protein
MHLAHYPRYSPHMGEMYDLNGLAIRPDPSFSGALSSDEPQFITLA